MTRTSTKWAEMGEGAAAEDVRAGNTAAASESEIRSALAAHFDADLHDAEITDDAAAALDALTRGYMHEALARGVVVVQETY